MHDLETSHAVYTLAVWAAVAELLQSPADRAVDVPLPGFDAAGRPWQLRRGDNLPFHAERRHNGATLITLDFGRGVVEEAARALLEFDRAHPHQQPSPLFELPAGDPLAAVPAAVQRAALALLLADVLGEDEADELMLERTDSEVHREIRRQGGWQAIEGYVLDAYSATVGSSR